MIDDWLETELFLVASLSNNHRLIHKYNILLLREYLQLYILNISIINKMQFDDMEQMEYLLKMAV